MSSYYTAGQAAEALGVSRATLYAYVSRGLLRSQPGPERTRLYARSEVEALKARAAPPRQAAREALFWGLPSLDSRISAVGGGELWYRGASAVELARSATPRQVAARLWQCAPEEIGDSADGDVAEPFLESALDHLVKRLADDPGGWDRSPGGVCRAGWKVFASWRAALPQEPLIDAALVLCADHELNASTFAARVAASTGANLFAVLLAALATLSGPRHGGACSAAEALVREARRLGSPRLALLQSLRRGEEITSFGHRLYPEGDPRARYLLAQLPHGQAWIEAGREVLSAYPSLDLALALLGLPEGQAFRVFATGRCLGWVAHTLEQHQDGRLIRPRAQAPEP